MVTVVTMVDEWNQELIHVAPVGYEFDRIKEPIQKKKPNRVILISHYSKDSPNKAEDYLQRIKNWLNSEKLPFTDEFCNINDLYDSMKVFRKIIVSNRNSKILINLSSGSKIVAIAGMLSSMLFGRNGDVDPYYVVPEVQLKDKEYKKKVKEFQKECKQLKLSCGDPESFGVKQIFSIPRYEIDPIKADSIEILRKISSLKNKEINNSDLMEFLSQKTLIKIENLPGKKRENEKKRLSIGTKRRFLDSLSEKHYPLVKIEKRGKEKIIKLTKDGENMLKIFEE